MIRSSACAARALPAPETSVRLLLGKHQCGVAASSRILAAELGLDEAHSHQIKQAAALHDVGKLYLPSSILLKCGPLNYDETMAMRQHPILGYAHLSSFKQSSMIKLAALIALQHHENFDGTGYPFGLSKGQIAIESSIVSICDVYHALRETRPYKSGFSHEASMQIIACGDDRTMPTMFDPAVLNAMINSQEQIRAAFARRHRPSPCLHLDDC